MSIDNSCSERSERSERNGINNEVKNDNKYESKSEATFLIFTDIETNHLDDNIGIPLDITLVAYNITEGKIDDTYQAIIFCTEEEFKKSDPESLKVNGITYEYVKKTGIPISKVRNDLLAIFDNHKITSRNARFICQNPSFDRPFFSKIIDSRVQKQHNFPYYWLDLASMYWFSNITKGKIPSSITLRSIATNLKLEPESIPHISMGGVKSLMECYLALVKNESMS